MVHAQASGDFAQPVSAGGEESAEEAALAEFFDAGPPALGAAAEAFEDARELGGDGGLAVAEETAGVIDQEQVAAERESFEHSFTGGIELASVFDRAEPDGFFQAFRCARPRDAALLRGFQVAGSALSLDVLDARR